MLEFLTLFGDRPQAARLGRATAFAPDGRLKLAATLTGLYGQPIPLDRNVPYHLGTTRNGDLDDALGARVACDCAQLCGAGQTRRDVAIEPLGQQTHTVRAERRALHCEPGIA